MSLPTQVAEELRGLGPTHKLYYEDAYIREFDSQVIKKIAFSGKIYLVLKATAFFAESGGQKGDSGILIGPRGRFRVINTIPVNEDVVVHVCEPIKGNISENERVHGVIDWDKRYGRMRHHTASHIVFAATREVLGVSRLIYMGVDVHENWARIDVNYDAPITDEQLLRIEELSNKICLENRPVRIFYMDREEAERIYGDKLGVTEVTPGGRVRVVEIKDWDVALCSGTHVKSTAEIGMIKILERYKLEKGVQRIRLAAGLSAYKKFADIVSRAFRTARLLNASLEDFDVKLEALLKKHKELESRVKKISKRLIRYEAESLLQRAEKIGEYKLIAYKSSEFDPETARGIALEAVRKDPSSVMIIGCIADKPYLIAVAGKNLVEHGLKMNEFIEDLRDILRGRGGGSPKIIQFVGESFSKLDDALIFLQTKIRSRVEDITGRHG